MRGGTESKPDTRPEGTEDVGGAFGWLRSPRDCCTTIELRKRGSVVAMAYGWIERFEFDPSEGITLHTQGKQSRIRGRNLNAEARPHTRLFQSICRNRVPWVIEAERSAVLKAAKDSVLIESIEWQA